VLTRGVDRTGSSVAVLKLCRRIGPVGVCFIGTNFADEPFRRDTNNTGGAGLGVACIGETCRLAGGLKFEFENVPGNWRSYWAAVTARFQAGAGSAGFQKHLV